MTNLDSVDRDAKVSIASDILGIEGKPERQVKVKSGSTLMVWFEVAALKPGLAEIVFTTASDILSERLVHKIEVERSYIYESFATIGRVGEGSGESFVEEGLVIPASADDGLGSLTLSLDGTRLGTLKDAVTYLCFYPYGCLEQRSAVILPLVIFSDYLEVFDIKSNAGDVKAAVEKELSHWAKYQSHQGGFPYWPDSSLKDSYYVSLRIAHIIALCRENGFKVPETLDTRRLLSFLKKPGESEKRSLPHCLQPLCNGHC